MESENVFNITGRPGSLVALIKKEISSSTRALLREIEFVKRQNDLILTLLKQQQVTAEEPCDEPTLPLLQMAQVDELEHRLANSDHARKHLCKMLSRIGGSTTHNTTANIMKYLFHDSVGVEFSLHGQKGKKAFNSTQLFHVIIEAVRKSPNTTSATQAEICGAIMAWLKNCRARLTTASKRTTTSERRLEESSCSKYEPHLFY
ncbi:uncharacterized protein LOC144116382 [Amblyomma americanum]